MSKNNPFDSVDKDRLKKLANKLYESSIQGEDRECILKEIKKIKELHNNTYKNNNDAKKRIKKKKSKKTPEHFYIYKDKYNNENVNYYNYIESKEWKRKRNLILKYYDKECRRCKSKNRLHIHHKTYKTLGNERYKDVEVLCYNCHATEHENKKYSFIDDLSYEFRKIINNYS